MNGYEELLSMMREEGKKGSPSSIQIGIMDSPTTCSIGKLQLSKQDLLIAEPLKTGYHIAVDNQTPSKKDATTFTEPLKQGDKVAIYRFSDEQYIILARLV